MSGLAKWTMFTAALLLIPAVDPGSTAGYYRRMYAPMPPISLAYLAAALERAGVDVRVHDEGASGDVEDAVRAATGGGWPPGGGRGGAGGAPGPV